MLAPDVSVLLTMENRAKQNGGRGVGIRSYESYQAGEENKFLLLGCRAWAAWEFKVIFAHAAILMILVGRIKT